MTAQTERPARRRTRRRAGRGRVRARPRGRRGPGHSGRPQRLPPVPAVALPGRHVAAAGRGHRPAAPRPSSASYPTVQIRTADVAEIDAGNLTLTLSDGDRITGSHLVIAAGARPEFFGVPGAAEHAFPLYSGRRRGAVAAAPAVGDPRRCRRGAGGRGRPRCRRGRRRSDRGRDHRRAHRTDDRAGRHGTDRQARDDHCGRPRQRPARTVLPKSHKYAHKRLTEQGADPRLGTGVAAVHADRVEFDDGSSIRTRTVIWGGGESAASVVGNAAGLTTVVAGGSTYCRT